MPGDATPPSPAPAPLCRQTTPPLVDVAASFFSSYTKAPVDLTPTDGLYLFSIAPVMHLLAPTRLRPLAQPVNVLRMPTAPSATRSTYNALILRLM